MSTRPEGFLNLDKILLMTGSNIPELQESNKYIKSYQQNKFEFLDKYYFYLCFS